MIKKQTRFLPPYFHFTGLLLMVAGLPFSVFMMSLSQFFIGLTWIFEGNYKEKWRRFRSNRSAWLLCGIFLMLIPTLLWTNDINEGLKIIRINLPFLIFPFVLASTPPLKQSWYNLLVKLFVVAVFLASVTCAIRGLPRWLNGDLPDIRKISVFISHIRFSLMIVLAIFLVIWAIAENQLTLKKWEKWTGVFMASCMFVFLLILQSLTGIAVIVAIGIAWMAKRLWHRYSKPKALLLFLIPLFVGFLLFFAAFRAYNKYTEPSEIYSQTLDSLTISAHPYSHDLSTIENGHYVNAYVSEFELRETWVVRSSYPIDSADGKGQRTYSTLIRFLNSKGLRKDKEGVMALSDKEIRHIEQGIANVKYTGLWGIRMRFYQLLWEFSYQKKNGKSSAGFTVMKFEFWKNALNIIREHPVAGTGIGDVPQTFRQQYKKSSSWLSPQWWMTSHNQFMYITVGCGITGLLLFLYFLVKPAFSANVKRYTPFLIFFTIAFTSMFTEDTLTTQAGVSFVAFFYSFFLFSRDSNSVSSSESSPRE